MTAAERHVALDPDQLPLGVAAAGPLRVVGGADNRSVRAILVIPVAVDAPDLWLAVSRRADGVLLAVAPLEATVDGRTREATISLHPPDDLDTVHLDVTADPTYAPPSAARRALRAATARGRVAARANRLGRDDEAALLWLACSQRWADAGDGERAAVAREWAALALERAGLGADAGQIRRGALVAREPWAQERARRLPLGGPPFLAELMPSPEHGARS
jgi:hypothetical protein